MTASTWQGMENLLPFWNQTEKPVSWSTESTARAHYGYDLILFILILLIPYVYNIYLKTFELQQECQRPAYYH